MDCVLPLFVDMSITRANIGSDRFSFRYKVNSVGRPSSSDQQQTIPGESNDKNVWVVRKLYLLLCMVKRVCSLCMTSTNRCRLSLECRLFLMASVFFPFSQAVPYSRDFKRKCDYFRSKLKRPVSVVSCWCVCDFI